MDELQEYINYLEKRLENQDNLIESLQRNLDAYGTFVQDMRITHKGRPNFGNSEIEVISID